jgi:hypothetical protein
VLKTLGNVPRLRARSAHARGVFTSDHRHILFDDAFQEELAALYAPSLRGQPPIPPAQLALATILQAYTGVSDDEQGVRPLFVCTDLKWDGE